MLPTWTDISHQTIARQLEYQQMIPCRNARWLVPESVQGICNHEQEINYFHIPKFHWRKITKFSSIM